jgi:hypothetical protein
MRCVKPYDTLYRVRHRAFNMYVGAFIHHAAPQSLAFKIAPDCF